MTNSNRRFGLFAKFLAAFLLVVLIAGGLGSWQASRAAQAEFSLFTTRAGQRQAELLSPILADYYAINQTWEGVAAVLSLPISSGRFGPGPGMGGQGNMGEMMRGMDVWQALGARVLVVDADGRIAADSAAELVGSQVDTADLEKGAAVMVNGRRVGTVLVTALGHTVNQNDLFIAEVKQGITVSMLIAGGAALLLGGLITWGITRPLRQLTHAAEAIAHGDLSQRVSLHPNDEIGDLAEAFNQMAARLERGEQLRRQMTADISHELRTPLTVILGNLDALEDGIFPLTTEALEPIRAKTELLTRLVEDLRQLALAEAGRLPLDREMTDLAGLSRRALRAFQPSAESKRITLHLEAPPDLPLVEVDPQRIEQVLVNLLSNALRYTPADGRITLTLIADNNGIRAAVRDNGPGIPAEAIGNVFERFYRVDKGRARETDGGGSGLGLAVARSIIEAHDGEIGVISAPGSGAEFWFKLKTE